MFFHIDDLIPTINSTLVFSPIGLSRADARLSSTETLYALKKHAGSDNIIHRILTRCTINNRAMNMVDDIHAPPQPLRSSPLDTPPSTAAPKRAGS